jgi:hypothetical protein
VGRGRSSPVWAALGDRSDSQGMAAYVARYLEWLRVHNYAEPTVKNRELYLGYFLVWAAERGPDATEGDHEADPRALPAQPLSPAQGHR